MDSKRLEELKKLGQELKDKNDARKESSEKAIEEMRAREEQFKKSFLGIENTIFRPFLQEANNALKVGGVELEYNSNTKSTDFKEQIKTFAQFFYKAPNVNRALQLPYIYFEGKPNTGEITIAKKKDGIPGTQLELVGNYKLDDLDAEKIEEILYSFILSFN